MASRRSSRRSSVGVNNYDSNQHQSANNSLGITVNSQPIELGPNALRRTSSSTVTDRRRSVSPALLKKASTGSLRNEALAAPGTPHGTIRRSSSHITMSSPLLGSRSQLAPQVEEELPPLTASSIAMEHFRKELELHQVEATDVGTLVILHDACYGHRYSRPKTTKTTLSMIVERPERIHAGILGITSAYVRMGERHAGGRHAPHPHRGPSTELPFKIKRTSREIPVTSSVVTNVHGTTWMGELKGLCNDAGRKLATTGKELVRTDSSGRTTGQPAKAKLHEGDLYLCTESLNAFQGALGGVCDGVDAVFNGTSSGQGPRTAFVCVRPPGHHCSADYPSGFCWLNNVHVGIEYATQAHGLTHAAIIDFDLHHGDGSQSMTWQHNNRVSKMGAKVPMSKKTAIGYFSLHDINSYPCEDGDIGKVQNASLCIEGAHAQTIWNVHLQPWKSEADFWHLYESRYNILLVKAKLFLQAHTRRLRDVPNAPPPKAAIFLSAGFDASEWESQGMQRHKVNVPTEFYARLTADIVKLSKDEDLAVEGRIVSVLEGGYSDRALTSGVLSHLSGLCHDTMSRSEEDKDRSGLAWEMGQRMAALALSSIDVKMEEDGQHTEKAADGHHYNKEWWNQDRLAQLEVLTGTQLPPPQHKKPSGQKLASTFASPTQSFTAKVVDSTKIRQNSRSFSSSYSRPVTPPPPDVDWATAAYELYKLLVPKDRPTNSCTPEELADTKTKKARQSDVGIITQAVATDASAVGGRELRNRKAKAPAPTNVASDDDSVASKRSVSRSDRRKTIADFPVAVEPPSATAMNMKKTRGDSTDPKANALPPVRRVPSAYVDRRRTPTGMGPLAGKSTIDGDTPGVNHDTMSAITNGLQRIRIKVPTEEERAVKEANRKAEALVVAAGEKKRTAMARAAAKKPAPPRVPRTVAAKKPTAKVTPTVNVTPAATAGQGVNTSAMVAAIADVSHAAPQSAKPLRNVTTLLQQPLDRSSQVAPTDPYVATALVSDNRSRSGSAEQLVPPPLEDLDNNRFGYPSPPHEQFPVPLQPVTNGAIEQVTTNKVSRPVRSDSPPQPPPNVASTAPPLMQQFVQYQPTCTAPPSLDPLESDSVPYLAAQQLTWMPMNVGVAQSHARALKSSNELAMPETSTTVGTMNAGPSTGSNEYSRKDIRSGLPHMAMSVGSQFVGNGNQDQAGTNQPEAQVQPSGPNTDKVTIAPASSAMERIDLEGRNLPVFTCNSAIPFATNRVPK